MIHVDDEKTTRHYDEHMQLHRDHKPAVLRHTLGHATNSVYFITKVDENGGSIPVYEWWIHGKKVAETFREWDEFRSLEGLSEEDAIILKLAFGGTS